MRYPMRYLACVILLAFAAIRPAIAHAFPDHAVPGAGAVLIQAPAAITVYFDSELEPVFSTLVVKNEQGVQVSQGNGDVDPANPAVLTTRLPASGKGAYHVYWSVVARDGHRTQGDYTFTVQ